MWAAVETQFKTVAGDRSWEERKKREEGRREDLSFVVQSHWVSAAAAAASCTGASLFGSSPEITTGTSNNIISVHSIIYIEINIIIYIYFKKPIYIYKKLYIFFLYIKKISFS